MMDGPGEEGVAGRPSKEGREGEGGLRAGRAVSAGAGQRSLSVGDQALAHCRVSMIGRAGLQLPTLHQLTSHAGKKSES